MTASDDFYKDLPILERFEEFCELSLYASMPQGWFVVIADIEGSTEAISAGRYKDVNMMGAACITAAINAVKSSSENIQFPYVFGGDGASLAIPGRLVPMVRQALVQTAALSESRFRLPMRVGFIPIDVIRGAGADVMVAKYQLSPGNNLAMFSGGGMEVADRLVKDPVAGERYRTKPETSGPAPELEGLSCRWSPIESQHGQIATVLVLSTNGEPANRAATYRRALKEIQTALRDDTSALSPASHRNLRFRWPPRFLGTEAKATAAGGAMAVIHRAIDILVQSAIQWYLHETGGKAGGYDAPKYLDELIANTDYRKFDDMLRFVLDCREGQIERLTDCLASLRETHDVAYGLHLSPTALMTCVVFDAEASEHVHFIDGGDGGFAIAAKQLKSQLAN